MTATTAPDAPRSATDRTPSPPRRPWALFAAAAIAVAVTALVLVFGVARPPALPSIDEQSVVVPTASIAWTAPTSSGAADGSQDTTCVHVVAPDGADREVVCERSWPELTGWDDEGIVLADWSGRAPVWVWYDAQTGEPVREAEDAELELDRDATRIRTRREDGALLVSVDSSRDVVWQVPAPAAYDVVAGARSPDGAFLALVDTADRLLVMPADGAQPPVVWAEGLASWQTPVWEGTPVDTAD